MFSIFLDLLNSGVIVYEDDILISAETQEEHDYLLETVLNRLKTNDLRLSADNERGKSGSHSDLEAASVSQTTSIISRFGQLLSILHPLSFTHTNAFNKPDTQEHTIWFFRRMQLCLQFIEKVDYNGSYTCAT
jgi:hypothetical protein